MSLLFNFLYNYVLIYVYIPMLILYFIGKPRFIIKTLNWILLIRHPMYKISIFFYASFFFVANMVLLYVQKESVTGKIEEIMQQAVSMGGNIYNNQLYEDNLRLLYRHERNIYIFLCFFIISMIYVKFSNVYEKTYELENKIVELKAGAGNSQPVDDQSKKNN